MNETNFLLNGNWTLGVWSTWNQETTYGEQGNGEWGVHNGGIRYWVIWNQAKDNMESGIGSRQ